MGTADSVALELRVNGERAVRIEPTEDTPNLLAGYKGNYFTTGVIGGTVAGGGAPVSSPNCVLDNYGTVGGGLENQAGSDDGNPATASSAVVAGGWRNAASGGGAAITGGEINIADALDAFVGGGYANVAHGQRSAVVGGRDNRADGQYATIGGGYQNRAAGTEATVAGGRSNSASGANASVPGGHSNTAAGTYSLAAGRRAKANHAGTFVWADSTDADFASAGNDQFVIRASGGVGIGTATPGFPLTFADSLGDKISLYGQSGSHFGLGVQGALLQIHGQGEASDIAFGYGSSSNFTEQMRITGTGRVGIGVTGPSETLDMNGTARLRGITAGSGTPVVADADGKLWKDSSSRRYKTDIRDLPQQVDAVLDLQPVSFRWQSTGEEEIGLIAEDVAQTVPELVICDDDGQPIAVKYDKIALYLLDVVKTQRDTLATLQCEKDAQIAAQQAEIADLRARLDRMETLMASLAETQSGGGR